jgi:predicted CXXCH cytochrome family protein
MRRILIVLVGTLLLSGVAMAQTIVGSSHDLSAALPTSQQVCVFCHTPHQPEGPPQVNTDPLWNHTLSATASYGVYASPTLDATPTDIGGGTAVSNLCMSCHDGTIGLGSLYNDPNIAGGLEETPTNSAAIIGGNANMGIDLSNDHPVNFTYDTALATADTGLEDPATNATVASWLIGGSVQCSSCHDVHDPTNLPFLRASNVNSALCTTCHTK